MCSSTEQDFQVTLFFEQRSFIMLMNSWQWWNGRSGKDKGKGKGKDKGKGKGKDPKGKGKGKDATGKQIGSSRPSGKGTVDMRNIKCHKCKKWGHYARDCWSEQTGERRGEVDMKKIQCYNCNKWGHYAKDCWADKADDSKGSGYERPSGKGEVNMKKIRCFKGCAQNHRNI